MKLPKYIPSGTKILYSINGEGAYTCREVAGLLGRPSELGISGYATNGYKGVAVAYRKAYIMRYRGKTYKFRYIKDASKVLYCSPANVRNLAKNEIIKLEEVWEKENEPKTSD